ncbi:helix-turn-helix transcriptional regulator [Aureimonas sp. Leaf454]|uniref:helix-turn-helix domain-containing protein n=1 Tax=Aureimonas sp. Leaf454 TaxID=1736381 RepID=UPI0012E33A60|nr:helix-turn-helix transcriptional regulator [Aureimonas sp. Leaf454]
MMSFQIEVDPREAASSELISDVGYQLQDALIEVKSRHQITQQKIAESLGVDRSRVNRCFSGYSNLTLKSLAELAWAMEKVARIKICDAHQEISVDDRRGHNYFERSIFADTSSRHSGRKIDFRRKPSPSNAQVKMGVFVGS